jgi:hypothetical protein
LSYSVVNKLSKRVNLFYVQHNVIRLSCELISRILLVSPIEYNKIEGCQLSSLTSLASIEILRYYERLKVEVITYDLHNIRRHLEIVLPLLE